MKRKVARLRLSPNEEAQLIREEHERRRKLRIQQVREQERCIALQIRQEVQRRRERELQNLEEALRGDWARQQKEKLQTLQKLYQESLLLIGQGHRSAKENEPDWAAAAQREEENHAKAEERYRGALRELKSQRQRDQEEQNRSIKARRKALQAEKERSAKVASLPPPPLNPIENIESKKQPVVKKSDINAFSATHYHMPETAVDREADTSHPNAQEVAEVEVWRLQELGKEAEREREEQLEKARLRGKHALRREQLTQDRERLLGQLEHMQQTDLLRRRQQVSQMPAQIFQPLYKRQEMREDCQREMEFAFEDMYTGERRVKGDLVLQLVPEPLPALSTDSQDQELDLTLEDVATPLEVTRQQTGSIEQQAPAQGEPSRPAGAPPRRALKKLLERVRSQRDQWTSHGSGVPTTDQPTTTTDHQIPERDMTIDTGSLSSEGSGRPPSPRLPGPSQSPPASETKEESIVAGTLLPPDVLANRIQTYEEERKRREEELEREKQQQVALLQELEEQKARLEQMLLEAQQERETLKAAVTQEVPVLHPEVPVHDQEVTSVTPGSAAEPVAAAGEDDHTRRIREYQQRLMEQNRLHHRSVEVARKRLEEYQRALQIRYNLTATSALPPAVPTCPAHPPLRPAGVAVPLAPPLQLPTSSAMPAHIPEADAQSQAPGEIPTRNSAILAPPPSLPGSGLSSRASLGIDSRALPVQLESSTKSPRDHRAGITAWLADSIMERATDHLPERLRPSSVTVDPLPYRPFTTQAASTIPPPPSSDPILAISPSMTDGPPSLPGQASFEPGVFLRDSPQEDMERQKRELQAVLRRVQEQREAMAQQQREQEEARRRQEEEREQMKRQREALQALINADAQPASEVADEVTVSQDVGETRLRLLASLLRAIEESNEGILSSLQDDQNQDDTVEQQLSTRDPTSQSDTFTGPAPPPAHLRSSPHLPPRAPKPPVARVRLGVMEMMMMTEQHELSAIQEVETPANASLVTGPEDNVRVLPPTLTTVPQEEPEPEPEPEPSVVSDRPLRSSSSGSSGGEQSAGRGTGSGTGSGRSSKLSWRERLMMEAGTSPEPAAAPPSLSQSSSDSGRGGTAYPGPAYPGPAITSYTSPAESTHRPLDPDCLSSTTISTGSYVTTDPEQNSSHIEDTSLLLTRLGVERVRSGPGLLDVSRPSSQSSYNGDDVDRSAPGRSSPAIDSLFHDSSIQRIIDKYTRELDISLNTAGNTTVSSADREGSSVEEPSGSAPQRPCAGVQEGGGREERAADSHSLPSDTESGGQRLEWDNTVNQILECFSDQVSSLARGQESFNPLIGQPADQSSCLAADQRDSPMERLIGQPSAHSSMIGPVTGQSVPASVDPGGWDSTLGRMIGRLSHQSGSQWLSGGRDFYASQLMGQMELEQLSWLHGGQDESQMRPLLGELDESGAQRSGSSGGRDSVDPGGPARSSVSSASVSAPEAQSHSSPVPGLDLQDQTLQIASSPQQQEPGMSGVNLASDSFHPLLAEVTQNETVEPSMTFHLPEEEGSSSTPVGSGHSSRGDPSLSVGSGHSSRGDPSLSVGSGYSPRGDPSLSVGSGQSPRGDPSLSEGLPEEEVETRDDSSVTSEPSPERFRAEEASLSLPTTADLQESLYHLTTSHCLSMDSASLASPNAQEAELAVLSLSGLTLGDDSPIRDLPPQEGDPCRLGCVFPVGEPNTGQPDVQQCSNQRNSAPIWDEIIAAASEKGILEESQLTLVSLTDTTLLDQDTTIMEEKGMEETCEEEEEREEGQKTEKEEKLETTLLPEETPASLNEENTQSCAVMSLEFHWSPSTAKQEAFQQKSRALHQRSAQRVEEMKAKRALAKALSEGQGQSKAKTQSALRPAITTKPKGAQYQAEDQSSETPCLVSAGGSKQEKPQLPLPMSKARLKKVDEVRICTPEQRQLDVSAMHQRTQRLYDQLEEVKQQKESRSRQESYTKNRLKAREFHKKTLQKLRAKQTPR